MGGTDASRRVGYYAALLVAALGIVTFVMAYLTPPISGPFCLTNCIEYPYNDIISRFPRDYLWLFPAMALSITYFVLMACIHDFAPLEQKLYTRIALCSAITATAVLVIDYFVQLSVIQASVMHNEREGIALLTQYNPHGVFIALEEVGFVFMSLSFFSAAPVFSGKNSLERAIRLLLRIGIVLTALAFVVCTVMYGLDREYRFEVASISINWGILMTGGVLLAFFFRRRSTE